MLIGTLLFIAFLSISISNDTNLNFYYFIAQKLGQGGQKTFSSIVSRIAVASIALGLATILVAFAILAGFQNQVQARLFSFSGHMRITKHSLNNSYEEAPLSTNTRLYQSPEKVSQIKYIYQYAQKAGILKTDEEVLGVIIKGLGKDYNTKLFSENIIEGEFIDFSGKDYSQDLLISKKVANQLRLAVGDSIVVFFVQDPPRFRKLRISGIYQTGMEEFDANVVLGDIGLVQRLNNWADTLVGGYEVWIKDFEKLENEALTEMLSNMDFDMRLELITDRHQDIFDWLLLLGKNVNIFLTLILIVAGFNMISILLIMMMERIQMIGILKALGASNWQIRKIFIYKGLLLTAKGMGLGNLIGLGFSALQYYLKIIPLDPENYYMDTVPIDWNWTVIVLMNLLTFAVIAVILLVPTFIIVRVQPVKAIRFD